MSIAESDLSELKKNTANVVLGGGRAKCTDELRKKYRFIDFLYFGVEQIEYSSIRTWLWIGDLMDLPCSTTVACLW